MGSGMTSWSVVEGERRCRPQPMEFLSGGGIPLSALPEPLRPSLFTITTRAVFWRGGGVDTRPRYQIAWGAGSGTQAFVCEN